MNRWGLIVAAVLVTAALSTKPAHAFVCCDTSSDSFTTTLVGTGSSCAAAQAALSAALQSQERSDCLSWDGTTRVCRFGVIYVDDCYDAGHGVLASKGYEEFECLISGCRLPPP
jgi:hypothetical protein